MKKSIEELVIQAWDIWAHDHTTGNVIEIVKPKIALSQSYKRAEGLTDTPDTGVHWHLFCDKAIGACGVDMKHEQNLIAIMLDVHSDGWACFTNWNKPTMQGKRTRLHKDSLMCEALVLHARTAKIMKASALVKV